MCGSKQFTVRRGNTMTMSLPTYSQTYTACYYEVTAGNATFTNLVDYSYTLEVVFNAVSRVTVTVLNGTSLEKASNPQYIYQTPQTLYFDATGGETVYFHVDGSTTSLTPEFSITGQTIVTRITEYPVENSEEEIADQELNIIYKPVIVYVYDEYEQQKVYKPRKPQYGLDILTLIITFGVLVYVPCSHTLDNWEKAFGKNRPKKLKRVDSSDLEEFDVHNKKNTILKSNPGLDTTQKPLKFTPDDPEINVEQQLPTQRHSIAEKGRS